MKFANWGKARVRKNLSSERGVCGFFSLRGTLNVCTKISPITHKIIEMTKTMVSPNASYKNMPVMGPVAKAKLTLMPK